MKKRKGTPKTPFQIYLSVFFFIVCATSLFFIDGLISDLLSNTRIKGVCSALIHYAYTLVHVGTCLHIYGFFPGAGD